MCRFCWVTVWETRIASALELDRLGDERSVGHLAAEVVRLEGAVALQALVAVEALEVEHCVDPNAVGVGAGGGADDDDRPADVLLGVRFDLLLGHVLDDVDPLFGEGGVVDGVHGVPVHHEVGVAVGEALVVDDLGMLEAHLAGQLHGGLARGEAIGDRQREAELHDPVAVVVGVGLDVLLIAARIRPRRERGVGRSLRRRSTRQR